jgi:phosphoribosyl 1,2-cyclic phosphate phosphodiesterase
MPCYGDARTISEITATFKYVFDPATPKGGGVPRLELIEVGDPFHVGADSVVPVPIFHGTRPILGYRIGGFAYLTDCSRIAEGSWPLLEGLDLLVLDALRDRPHSTHFTLAEAVDVARRIAPRRTLFTHMCHDLGHAETCARLPEGMALAYDGLVVDVSDSRIRNSEPRVPSPEHPPFDKAQGRPGAPEGRAPSV